MTQNAGRFIDLAGTFRASSGTMRLTMRFVRLLIMIACSVVLTGCIAVPLPHVTRKGPSVRGKVVDQVTGKPIEGALVELITREGGARHYAWSGGDPQPGPTAKTGADGEFHVWTGFNFHLFWYANVSWQFHWPTGAYWGGQLLVTREGYSDLKPPVLHGWNGEYSSKVEEIRLVPIPRDE